MKLAISNLAWNSNENVQVYEYLKSKNIHYLEIAPTKIVGEDPYDKISALKDYASMLQEKYDLKIISMQSIWFKVEENIFESDKSYQKLLAYTKKAIDFASSIKCSNLVFGCPRNRNMFAKEQDYPKAIKFFQELGNYALLKDVVIAIEPNPVIYNTNFLNYTKEAIDFVKEINLPSIKINYDLGTVIFNQESFNILKENMMLIHHIHISEPNLLKISKRDLHEELFTILKTLNYPFYVSIEMKENSIEDVKEVIDYICSLNEVS